MARYIDVHTLILSVLRGNLYGIVTSTLKTHSDDFGKGIFQDFEVLLRAFIRKTLNLPRQTPAP